MTAERPSYTLDPLQLEAAFEALRKAADAFRLSAIEVRLHRWLGRSSKLAAGAFAGLALSLPTGVGGSFVSTPLILIFLAASAAAGLLLLANIWLVIGAIRQRRLLKKLGLHAVSLAAWKAERRRHLFGWIGDASLKAVGVVLMILASVVALLVLGPFSGMPVTTKLALFAPFGIPGATVLVWRMVERSREQLAIVADADRLRAMLTSMQAQSGAGPVVVPAAVMEKVATIENAQIVRERAHAVVASVRSADRGYALVLAQDATMQRAALGPGERLVVEELIEEVLAAPEAGVSPARGDLRQARSTDGSVEIDYRVDESARRVHIMAVRALNPLAVSH